MKKYIFILAVCFMFNLNADDNNASNTQNKPQATQLELFLFKIGFNSLLNDYNNSKEDISQNSQKIKELEKKMDYIIVKLNELSKENSLSIKPKINENATVEEKVIELKKLSVKDTNNTITPVVASNDTNESLIDYDYIFFGVKDNEKFQIRRQDGISIYSKPNRQTSQKIGTLEHLSIIELDGCNRYDWCKLKGKEGYIPKYLIKKYKGE